MVKQILHSLEDQQELAGSFLLFPDRKTKRQKNGVQNNALPHQAGIEILDFHARVWKSDQGGRNSMQEMHGNQTKCMEFKPIKENSSF